MLAAKPYIYLMRLHKPIGIYLLMWPCLWALWIAYQGTPPPALLLQFMCGVVIMRSLGCIINDIADKDIDPHVERTKTRPLANNTLTIQSALRLAATLLLIAIGILFTLPTNTWDYALIAAIATAVYPLCKRFFHCPQLILGIAFSLSIPMVFATKTQALPNTCWQLFFIAILWPVIYDTQYALTDKADDLKIGIHSSAIWLGNYALITVNILQLLFCSAWIIFSIQQHFHPYTTAILSSISILFIYQTILCRKYKRHLSAFLNNHWVGCIIFIALYAQYTYLS